MNITRKDLFNGGWAGIDRGVDVVMSCETIPQLSVAHRYLHLAGIRTGLRLNDTLWKSMQGFLLRKAEAINREIKND